MVGCSSKQSASLPGQATDAKQGARPPEEKDFQTWKLADGTEFNCWVSGANKAGKPMWIWCDLSSRPVSYRIVSGGKASEWKEMRKIDVKDDGKVVPDPNGKYGATETLPAGKFCVDFKIGAEQFSAVTAKVN
jgi:hypothetical protein